LEEEEEEAALICKTILPQAQSSTLKTGLPQIKNVAIPYMRGIFLKIRLIGLSSK
jgi:hypothetical protein